MLLSGVKMMHSHLVWRSSGPRNTLSISKLWQTMVIFMSFFFLFYVYCAKTVSSMLRITDCEVSVSGGGAEREVKINVVLGMCPICQDGVTS